MIFIFIMILLDFYLFDSVGEEEGLKLTLQSQRQVTSVARGFCFSFFMFCRLRGRRAEITHLEVCCACLVPSRFQALSGSSFWTDKI